MRQVGLVQPAVEGSVTLVPVNSGDIFLSAIAKMFEPFKVVVTSSVLSLPRAVGLEDQQCTGH